MFEWELDILDKVQVWSETNKLRYDPGKSDVSEFWNKRLTTVFYSKNIWLAAITKKVKYLGIMSDHHFSWNAHYAEKARRLKASLVYYQRMAKETWDLALDKIICLNNTRIRLVLSHGVRIWLNFTHFTNHGMELELRGVTCRNSAYTEFFRRRSSKNCCLARDADEWTQRQKIRNEKSKAMQRPVNLCCLGVRSYRWP